MGCCCCGSNKTTFDAPEGYEKNRSCTDILFGIIFVLFWIAFIVLGVISFQNGDIRMVLRGHDYLSYYCGDGEGPPEFSKYIADNALFQSKVWSENTYVWYPSPNLNGFPSIGEIRGLSDLGVCVKKCPKVDEEAVTAYVTDPTSVDPELLSRMKIYSYGSVSATGKQVHSASNMFVLYDTSLMLSKCLPSREQPEVVKKHLKDNTFLGKVYSFASQGIHEVWSSKYIFIIEVGIILVLCFVFIFLIRLLIDVIVWILLILVFLLLLGGGSVSFFLYYTKGQNSVFPVVGVEDYGTFFLVAAVVIWVVAFIYLIVMIALSSKIRLVSSILKIAGRVLSSAPSLFLVSLVTSLLFIALFVWSLAIGIFLYTAVSEDIKISLIPVSDALSFEGAPQVNIEGNAYFQILSGELNARYATEFLFAGNVFGFLWSIGFINAVCFTTIAFASVFWYFSSLSDSEKEVPFGGVCRALCWTLFYHAGTMALGSLLIAIIQMLRLILGYFARKADSILNQNSAVKCLVCYLECFLACFERLIASISRNAYVMMCLTSDCFCFSACKAISMMVSNMSEMVFLVWFLNIIIFFGKLLVIGVSCLSTYFFLGIEELAPDVELKALPIILVGAIAYFLSSVFFMVYESSSNALLVCYCYDRKINAGRGMYYVPSELEDQIDGYLQERKLEEYEKSQAAAHTQ